jgi:lysine 6-dehydrogenase
MRMLVLGAGLQGSACAYDLLQNPAIAEVRLADRDTTALPEFLARYAADPRLVRIALDAKDPIAVSRAMDGVTAVLCALPYYFNLEMTRLAIEAGVHFCDLGGNTEIVFKQKGLDAAARKKGISVIPDCGLAPGMVNILAQLGISRVDKASRVKIFVGGLPQNPEGPLKYQIVYSLEGVLDYYTTLSSVLRGGRRTMVNALSEVEAVKFDAPVGELEAFHTAGGLSTMATRYEGQIPTMEYKTLRYPGHAHIMEAIRDLGLIDAKPIDVKGVKISPRDVAVAVMTPHLKKPASPDLVALRVIVEGTKAGRAVTHTFEMIDHFDEVHGISAMERTTGYSLSITGQLQAEGAMRGDGVLTPDECVPGERYIAELAERGIVIRETIH